MLVVCRRHEIGRFACCLSTCYHYATKYVGGHKINRGHEIELFPCCLSPCSGLGGQLVQVAIIGNCLFDSDSFGKWKSPSINRGVYYVVPLVQVAIIENCLFDSESFDKWKSPSIMGVYYVVPFVEGFGNITMCASTGCCLLCLLRLLDTSTCSSAASRAHSGLELISLETTSVSRCPLSGRRLPIGSPDPRQSQ
jgi:hypothetical protein